VYDVPPTQGLARLDVSLDGLWEVAPWDLFTIDDATRLRAETQLPDSPTAKIYRFEIVKGDTAGQLAAQPWSNAG
jgi:hypothetical protein